MSNFRMTGNTMKMSTFMHTRNAQPSLENFQETCKKASQLMYALKRIIIIVLESLRKIALESVSKVIRLSYCNVQLSCFDSNC